MQFPLPALRKAVNDHQGNLGTTFFQNTAEQAIGREEGFPRN